MSVESTHGVELLLDVGLDARVTGSADLDVQGDDGRWTRRQVLVLGHSPSPQELERALAALKPGRADGVLFVVARAGSALKDAARRDPRIAFAATEQGIVAYQGVLHHAAQRPEVTPRTSRTSWARWGALRLLTLVEAPLSQAEIARRIGLSHVAVGKQLPALEPLVERTPDGWRATDRTACWERFMADYPGPRGLASFWTATGDIAAQQTRLEEAAADEPLALSGDAAADLYAPWRRPTRIVAYVTGQPPLERYGFAQVRSTEATVELRVAKDPTVRALSRERLGRRYVDPLLAAWDLARSTGGDIPDAVDELRRCALKGSTWS